MPGAFPGILEAFGCLLFCIKKSERWCCEAVSRGAGRKWRNSDIPTHRGSSSKHLSNSSVSFVDSKTKPATVMKSTILFPVKPTLLTLFALFFLFTIPQQANARQSNNFITANVIDADIVPRLSHKDAEIGITSREGSVDLLLTNEAILIQFTDTFLEKIEGEILDSDDLSDATHLGTVIRSMVSSGVTTLLDRALAIPLYEIDKVYYKNGRLYIINREGKELFEGMEIDEIQVMEDFSRRDARRFVDEAEKRMI